MTLVEKAPGKVNLCLYVGAPRRHDGLHPLVSVVQPVSLADIVTLEAGEDRDQVICPGVTGENLAARAIALFREATGWDGPPVRITIGKHVPIAGGMGGGSGDAAAVLRLLARHTGIDADLLSIAPRLGMDVASQVTPRRCLMLGAGETVEPLPAAPPETYVIVPSRHALATPDVYREADRLRSTRELAGLAERARAGDWEHVNDLQDAALSLCPAIAAALDRVRAAGARHVLVSGSGPTVFGVFPERADAARAAASIPGATLAEPVPSPPA